MKKLGLKRIIRRIKFFSHFIREVFSWEYESCKKCGSIFRIMWHVDDHIWQEVVGVNDDTGGSLCVDCFVKLAEKKVFILNLKKLN